MDHAAPLPPGWKPLLAHQRVAVVGVEVHRLARALAVASMLRQGRPFDRLEVFLPAETAQRPDIPPEHPRHEELLAVMPAVARCWALYEHSEPAIAATYWDWQRRGGRVLCAGEVFHWSEPVPGAAYADLVFDLRNLRSHDARLVRLGASTSPPAMVPAG
jgi:hypothetical protein